MFYFSQNINNTKAKNDYKIVLIFILNYSNNGEGNSINTK